MYRNESEMYPHVSAWLERFLLSRLGKFSDVRIIVEDTSQKSLSMWLYEKGLHRYFRDYNTFEVEVDITGVVEFKNRKAYIILIECKLEKIKLRDIGQLLGYSKVVKPHIAMILSPSGLSDSLGLLLKVYRRYDILSYDQGKHIVVGKWSHARFEPDFSSLIPENILERYMNTIAPY
jgi:hypothetical protein